MKQVLDHRNSTLFFGAIAILLLTLLAASLDSMDFQKGKPFSYLEEVEESSPTHEMPGMGWIYFIVIGIYIIIMFIILVYAPKKKRRKIILALLGFILGLLGIMWWMTLLRNESQAPVPASTVPHETLPSNQAALVEEEQVEEIIFVEPQISPWISIGISFGVLLVVAVIIRFALKNQFKDKIPLEELVEIAEKAIHDLNSGEDYGDTVVNCYASMMEALNNKRFIFRRGDLTPTEFITVLGRTNLPNASVIKLTALFERVRYGGKRTSTEEVDEAISCLNEIVGAIRDGQ